MSTELKITKERVLKAAEKCSTAKDTLKELFPEAFEAEPFDFTRQHIITPTIRGPLFIGHASAPYGMRAKCLMVSNDYEMEVTESGGYKCLIFRKKP